MEYQKIITLLNNIQNKSSKLRTRNKGWITRDVNVSNQIKFKTFEKVKFMWL